MRHSRNSWRYSPFLFCGGLTALIFILFWQPMDPAQFIASAFHGSYIQDMKVNSAQSATVAFWSALIILMFGSAGMLLRLLQQRRQDSDIKSPSSSEADNGEEDWIFI